MLPDVQRDMPVGPGPVAASDPPAVARLHEATRLSELYATLASILSGLSLPDRISVLECGDDGFYRVTFSTEILDTARSAIALPAGDPLLGALDPDGVFLASPDTAPRVLAWRDMELPAFGVLALRAAGDSAGPAPACLVVHGSHAVPGALRQVLRRVVRHFELALLRLRLAEEYRRSAWHSEEALAAMNDMGALMGTLDLQILLTKILELALHLCAADVGSILLRRGGELMVAAEWGFTEAEMKSMRTHDGRLFVEAVLESGEAEYVPDLYLDPRLDTGAGGLAVDSLVVLPLATNNGPLGAIVVVNASEENGFSVDRLSTLRTISSLAAIAVENARFHREALENEKLKEQARIAETIQKGFFPRSIPQVAGYEVAGHTVPAQFVGGDYYDFVSLGGGRLGIVVADVSGHGISSGLVMTMTRTLFRAEAPKTVSPAILLMVLNAHLCEEDLNGAFVTLLYAVLDARRGELRMASAGHTPLLHLRARLDHVEVVEAGGLPLGLFDNADYDEHVLEVEPGDSLLFLTDGLPEAMSSGRRPFGLEPLGKALRRLRDLSPGECLDAIHQTVLDHTSPATPHDDLTTVLVRALPKAA